MTEYEGSYDEFEALVLAEDRAPLREALRETAREPCDHEHEFRVVHPQGGVRWILGRGRVYFDSEQRASHVAGVFMDITARRCLEERLLQAQRLDAIGQLAGGIAHDFNNILGAIICNASLLQAELAESTRGALSLAEIVRASERAKGLVQQILSFGRPQPIEKRALALAPIVEEAAGLLRATLPSNVELTTRCAPDAPLVTANATQIHQVLLNIGTNAWHALSEYGGRIDVQLEWRCITAREASPRAALHGALRPGSYACITVRDTGRGMDAATQARIFQPFFTTKAADRGTGLGLSVVADIVKGHRGAVIVNSRPGCGTIFELYFPAFEPGHVSKAQAPAPRAPDPLILYVDDEPSLMRVVKGVLEQTGYRVQAFTRGVDALAAFRAAPAGFALAITDYTMPGADGLELARALLGLRPDLPVLLTSGHISDELLERAELAGIRRVMAKPIPIQDFCEVVQRELY